MSIASYGSSSSTCVLSRNPQARLLSRTSISYEVPVKAMLPTRSEPPTAVSPASGHQPISSPYSRTPTSAHTESFSTRPNILPPLQPLSGGSSDPRRHTAFPPVSAGTLYNRGIHDKQPDPQTRPRPFSNHPPAEISLNEDEGRSLHNRNASTSTFAAPRTISHRASDVTMSAAAQHQQRDLTRCSLIIRQQPRAARAGPDGKDRRSIDPPPILQLMMNDFDPESPEDVAELSSAFWVVHCRLIAAQEPDRDLSTQTQMNDDGRLQVQRLLLGTTVASPTHTSDDPDPDPARMPHHPRTRPLRPRSPSEAVLPGLGRAGPNPDRYPCTFFIFADISVRKAGDYKLQFTLMKMGAEVLRPGASVPFIHVLTSDAFRAVNAKDFDQVQASTPLVKGLIDRGAGFPLKLKKGTREGQKRRRPQSESDSEDDNESED